MKTFLATTALALVLGGSAYAAPVQFNTYQAQPSDVQASEFIGQRIYASDTDFPADQMVKSGAEKDWDDVGEINEVILGRDGAVKAVVLGVGGFLGMGEKNVAVNMNDVKFVRNGDSADDYFLVINANKDLLTKAPAFTMPADKRAAADDAATTDNQQTASTKSGEAVQTTMADDRSRLTRPEISRDGYVAAENAELTADKLQGARVYGAKDEDVGEVNKLVMGDNGQVKTIVLDIGGFLGMGEHQIAVTPDELTIVRNADGSDVRVYIDANKDALMAQPEYHASAN